MNGEYKIRPQVLETPYKLQDICPTKKLKAPEDTLRRIQKKIAFAEKKALSLENDKQNSIQNEIVHSEKTSPLFSVKENAEDSHKWVNEFRKRYKAKTLSEEWNDALEMEWYTASDIFQQVAITYSNEIFNLDSWDLSTRKI